MTKESTQSDFNELLPLLRIDSGGQTGADRSALDVARKFNFPYGGWCPKGRKAEDGPLSADYCLDESPSGNYLQRTEWNARDSDGTVIFTMARELTGGSKRTADFARKHGKPCLHLHSESHDAVQRLRDFIHRHQIRQLNVAGSRGSKEPELYAWVSKVMEEALFDGEPQCFTGEALSYLGPEIELTGVIDNADAPNGYGDECRPGLWRFYYQLKQSSTLHVGGGQPYLLIEKGTGRIRGTGMERGE